MNTPDYRGRRHELMAALPNALLLLPANQPAPMNYRANEYPFRQDSTFYYYTGIDRPDLVLLIDTAAGQSCLYGDDRSLDAIVWMGTAPSIGELVEQSAISTHAPLAQLATDLRNSALDIHYLPPYRAQREQYLATLLAQPLDAVRTAASAALIRAVAAQRSRKDPYEQAAMERAVNLSGKIHRLAMEQARLGQLEAVVAGQLEGLALAEGRGLGYPAIVTTNGQILHNHDHSQELGAGDLLLVDAGAQIQEYYTGDITRTFPISPQFEERQRAIYQLVLDAQEQVIAGLGPGIRFRDCHLQAAFVMTSGLIELGLMKGDPHEAVAAGAHALFFPHGLGHHIGLDVHDMEDFGEDYIGYDDQVRRSGQFGLNALRLGKALEIGNVVTVEPGLYFIPALIDRWQSEQQHKPFINYSALAQWRDFGGVRIEDDILITPEGYRVLGEPIPKTIAEIEAIRS